MVSDVRMVSPVLASERYLVSVDLVERSQFLGSEDKAVSHVVVGFVEGSRCTGLEGFLVSTVLVGLAKASGPWVRRVERRPFSQSP